MKTLALFALLYISSISFTFSQSLSDARTMYLSGNYKGALPIFENELAANPTDASLNQWYGSCLVETGGNLKKAEECLLIASKKSIQDSFVYLGRAYTRQYRFEEAEAMFDQYEEMLTKRNPRKKKDEIERDAKALEKLEVYKKEFNRLRRMATNSEDIQIIDSLVLDKEQFLSAYKLSHSGGKLRYFNQVFSSNIPVLSTIYFNEKETKIYYSQPDSSGVYSLFSMQKLLEGYGNEKRLSSTNFGMNGDMNYPFVMPDGVTIYFAAEDEESIGGYDLFISRYNLNNDTYLSPERMNMPFNSIYNDYMLVVDEEKGVGWFASDRFQEEGKVCIYTFIPNKSVKIVDSDNESYHSRRALITSIKESWVKDTNYASIINTARKDAVEETKQLRDFDFVINDKYTYHAFADFKNQSARDLYFKVVQMKSELRNRETALENARTQYATSAEDTRRSLTSSIMEMEKQVEQLQKEIPLLEMQARNMEIQELM